MKARKRKEQGMKERKSKAGTRGAAASRALSMVLALTLALAMAGGAAPAWASETTGDVGDLTYKYDSEQVASGAEVTSLSTEGATATALEVPAEVTFDGQEYTVKSIATDAFKDNTSLASVTIPGSVAIGSGAFSGDTALANVYFRGEPTAQAPSAGVFETTGITFHYPGAYSEDYSTYLTSVLEGNSTVLQYAVTADYPATLGSVTLETAAGTAVSSGGYVDTNTKVLIAVTPNTNVVIDEVTWNDDPLTALSPGLYEATVTGMDVALTVTLREADSYQVNKASMSNGTVNAVTSAYEGSTVEVAYLPATLGQTGRKYVADVYNSYISYDSTTVSVYTLNPTEKGFSFTMPQASVTIYVRYIEPDLTPQETVDHIASLIKAGGDRALSYGNYNASSFTQGDEVAKLYLRYTTLSWVRSLTWSSALNVDIKFADVAVGEYAPPALPSRTSPDEGRDGSYTATVTVSLEGATAATATVKGAIKVAYPDGTVNRFVAADTWSRLAGDDRYETMRLIANSLSGRTAIVTTALNFPDALAAAGLSGALGTTPILLTDTSSLSSETATYLKNNNIWYAYVIGGENAVSPAVFNAVRDAVKANRDRATADWQKWLNTNKDVAGSLDYYSLLPNPDLEEGEWIKRVAGDDRSATARAIFEAGTFKDWSSEWREMQASPARYASVERHATESVWNEATQEYDRVEREAVSHWGDTLIVSDGGNFADALSISPYTASTDTPLFLADRAAGLDSATLALIKDNLRPAVDPDDPDADRYPAGFARAVIVGGTSAVPTSVEAQLEAAGIPKGAITRIAGAHRYETSAKIADFSVLDTSTRYFDADDYFYRGYITTYDYPYVATGANFPDALAAGPLAGRSGHVLLLAEDSADGHFAINGVIGAQKNYIHDGTVLGGTAAVPPAVRQAIKAALAG